ncbi:DNA-processing protein DprA [Muricomes intestini]|jgi:DNA processing protein|uniref:DNA processing protein n=1 Tax=Muricomes intestini TaxID=1796634 RepID=A0A4R3K1Z7_9FIRM|nr:DNA-processing protein DprA [Muricomes intestini]TCS75998.1 DNA processing protein [Muricomes intestini]HAX53620.1 DNA-protecting protein DprA [Lachnospiraceae bacterium]HCR83438.1 DNA-protecting protein DprA [Lachnospiraceae bacterium]
MKYEYWFAQIARVNDRKKYFLREYLGTAKDIFYIEEMKLNKMEFLNEQDVNTIMQAKKTLDPDMLYKDLKKKSIRFIPWFSEEFPEKLCEIPTPPYALYVKGSIPERTKKTVAIVGARRCTHYGEKYALEYGEKLAQCDVSVISGLARGIDGAGHRGALMGKGSTYAVLGCGVDICYPREHIGLYTDILRQQGGILSEFPPGTPPVGCNFPRRNRIISGLSDVVLVMEAGEKSGSLITADMALEQGRDIYALPGPVNSSLSRGCNQLIRQGAGILLSPERLLDELGILPISSGENTDKNKKVLETGENMVYSRLCPYPKNLSQLAEETDLPPGEVLEKLVSLELQGYVKEISKNYYVTL